MNPVRTLFRLTRMLADYRRGSETVAFPPIRLWVETASRCNLRCTMCPNRNMAPADKTLMPLDLFQKIVDEARGFANDIYLHHRGEPLLNPALFEMIAYARAAGIRTRFHTNGALLDEDKAEKLLAAGPDLVSFSVDGFEKASYEQVRVGARYEKTVENIERFARLRNAKGLRRPYVVVEKIRFRNPATPENQDLIRTQWRKFLDAGVDEVIEKAEYEWAEETASEDTAPCSYSKCTFPWYAMVICANGTVTPCPQDYWAKLAMGNARENTLREIWNAEPYRQLRRGLLRDLSSLSLCRKCDRLRRKTVGGVPFQYMIPFVVDHLFGYGRIRKWLGTSERN